MFLVQVGYVYRGCVSGLVPMFLARLRKTNRACKPQAHVAAAHECVSGLTLLESLLSTRNRTSSVSRLCRTPAAFKPLHWEQLYFTHRFSYTISMGSYFYLTPSSEQSMIWRLLVLITGLLPFVCNLFRSLNCHFWLHSRRPAVFFNSNYNIVSSWR